MSSSNFAGFSAVNLRTLRITSLVTQKTADISRLVKSFEIYQSLFDPSMTALLEVEDPTGIIYDLPLLGEEFVTIEFETEGKALFSKTFLVNKPSDIERDNSMQRQRLRLELVSMEQLRGLTTIIDNGYSAHISTVVETLLKYVLKTSRPLEIEQTRGSESFIIPSWTLWDTFEFLRQRAVSAKYDSPMLFFEDTTGFKFVSCEYLIELKKDFGNTINITSEPFNVGAGDGPNYVTIRNEQYLNAENFRIITKADTARLINSGGLSNRTQVYDVINKRLDVYDLDFKQFADEVVKQPLSDKFNPHHSGFLHGILKKPVVRYMVPIDSTNPTEFAKNIGRRQMFTKQLGDIQIGFSLYGNSELTVGDLVNVLIPRVSDSGEDQQLNGVYIIGRLKHSFADDQLFTHVEAYRFGHNEQTFDIPLVNS